MSKFPETLAEATIVDEEEETFTVTDSRGRVIVYRAIDFIEQYDVAKCVGDNSSNPMMMGLALRVAGVRSIDGVPRVIPKNEAQLRAAIKAVGKSGAVAIAEAEQKAAEQAKAIAEDVKN
jgi:hypothetical protein